jgi:hypothetical protein
MDEPPTPPTAPTPGTTPTPNPPILYLDVDDEITSAAARIRSAEGDRVALVVPFGSRLATSRINFRLLAREATERGKSIEIVAADASARALAGSAGLVVHPSVAAFEGREPAEAGNGSTPATGATLGVERAVPGQRVDEDTATKVYAGAPTIEHPALAKPRDRAKVPLVGPARPPIRRRVAAGVGLALVALLSAAAWAAVFVLPSATISVAPWSEDAGPIELTIEARPDVTAPDATSLLIPAAHFTFDLEVSDSFPATGVKVTETKATGTVRFENRDPFGSRRIDAQSIVSTESGIDFVVLAEVTLPPASIDFPTIIPSTSSVGVEAVVAGPEGNVKADSITVVPKGVNKEAIKVTNPEPTAGGTRTESPRVSQDDVDAALTALSEQLTASLAAAIADPVDVPAGTRLFAETGVVGDATPTVDPASLVGTDAADFELGLTATGTVLGVDPGPLDALAEARLNGEIDEGWRVADGSIDVTVGEPSVFGESVTFPVTVRATQVRVVDRETVIAEARGLLLADARARLEAYGDVEISLWPDWVTNVPDDPSKVAVTILDPRPAASKAPGS